MHVAATRARRALQAAGGHAGRAAPPAGPPQAAIGRLAPGRAPKFRPTMQCHVGLCFLSNSFFMYAAISFSMLNFSSACACSRGPVNASPDATARTPAARLAAGGLPLTRGPGSGARIGQACRRGPPSCSLGQDLRGAVYRVLRHLLRHIRILYDRLSVRHPGCPRVQLAPALPFVLGKLVS